MRWSAVWLALSLCACKAKPSTPPTDEGATAPSQVDAAVAAIAARIDPGPQTPLLETMPAWLKGKVDAFVGEQPGDAASVAAAREAIAGWDKIKPGDIQSMIAGGLMLLRGVVLAERAVAAGSSDPELLAALAKAYRVIEQLAMFQRGGFFAQMYEMGIELARKEGKLETQQIEEIVGLLGKAIERAPALHMHTAARLLRKHPSHPTAVEVLLRVAQADVDAERWVDAVTARRLAVELKGDRASAEDLAGAAGTCYRALDLSCGDMYRKSAEARGPEDPGDPKKVEALQKRLAELDAQGKEAREVVALAQAMTLDEGVRRGYLLMRLGRNADAEVLFTGLRAAHPGDARPVTGQAILRVQRGMDFAGAAALTREARTLAGRDRAYYEVALGTLPIMLLTDLMRRYSEAPDKLGVAILAAVAEVEGLVREFAAFDPARAAVLELVLEIGKQVLPKGPGELEREKLVAAMRGSGKQAMGLLAKFPESPDVWRLIFMAARLTGSAPEAAAMVTTPLPAALQKDADIRLQQIRAMIDLALQWNHVPLLEAALRAAEDLPEALDADTRLTVQATLDTLFGKGGSDPARLRKAADSFTELAGRKTGKEQALLHNNAGIARAFAGDAEGAVKALNAAREAAPDELTPLLNMAAVAEAVGQLDGVADAFGKAARDGDNSTLRLQAYAWLVTLADAGTGDREVTRREFHEALAREREGEIRGNLQLGLWGVVSTGEFKMSFGYSTQGGLQLIDEVVSRWWLIVPARAIDGLTVEAAAAKKEVPSKGKKGKKGAATPAPAGPSGGLPRPAK